MSIAIAIAVAIAVIGAVLVNVLWPAHKIAAIWVTYGVIIAALLPIFATWHQTVLAEASGPTNSVLRLQASASVERLRAMKAKFDRESGDLMAKHMRETRALHAAGEIPGTPESLSVFYRQSDETTALTYRHGVEFGVLRPELVVLKDRLIARVGRPRPTGDSIVDMMNGHGERAINWGSLAGADVVGSVAGLLAVMAEQLPPD